MNPECQIMPEFPLMPSRRPRSRVVPNRRTQRRVGVPNYGFRYYGPVSGRWPSRDPVGEEGWVNVYSLGPNSPLAGWDVLGRGWSGPVDPVSGGKVPPANRPGQPPPDPALPNQHPMPGAANVTDLAGSARVPASGNAAAATGGAVLVANYVLSQLVQARDARANAASLGAVKSWCETNWGRLKREHPRFFNDSCPACCLYQYQGTSQMLTAPDGSTVEADQFSNYQTLGFETGTCSALLRARDEEKRRVGSIGPLGVSFYFGGFDYGN